MSGSRAWVPELDGWRGVAVGLVVLHHVWVASPAPPRGIWAVVPDVGWIGVDGFFVLSGFLITGILVQSRSSPRYWRNFAIRRALRIVPLYALLVGSILVALRLATGAWAADPPAWSYALFLSNWWVAGFAVFPDLVLNITWSVAIEEQFYLAYPAVVRVAGARLPAILGAVVALAPLVRLASWDGVHELPAYVLTPCRMDALALGGLAWLASRSRWGAAVARAAVPLGLLVAALVVAGLVDRKAGWFVVGGYTLVAAAAASALVAVARGELPGARSVLRSWPLRALGRVSYGVYLLHPLCLGLVATAAVRTIGSPDVEHPAAFALVLVAGPALTLLAAAASWRYLEAPALAWKDRWAPDR